MTNRKKSILILLALSLLATTGCKKEEVRERTTVDFTVSLEGHSGKDTKMHLNDDWKPCWDLNPKDHIQINDASSVEVTPNSSNPTRGTFTATISGSTYYAVYPAGIIEGDEVTATPTINLPRVQVYETVNGKQKINAPMAAYNPSHPVLEFKNLCGLMEITVNNDKAWDMVLDSIHVEASSALLSGSLPVQSMASTAPYLSGTNGGSGKNIVSLAGELKSSNAVIGDDHESLNIRVYSSQLQNNSESTPTSAKLYVYLPVINSSSNKFTIRVFSHPLISKIASPTIYSEDPEVHIVYSRTQSTENDGSVSRSERIPLTFSLLSATNSVSPQITSMKAFSVGTSSDNKVCFSRGNVQYHTGLNKWRFAPRPWSFVGREDALINHNTVTPGWMEYFSWASGSNPTLYANSLSSQRPNADLEGTYRSYDWGVNYTNTSITWRTPSKDEYDYVFKSRTTAQMLNGNTRKYGWGTLSYGSNNSSDPYNTIPYQAEDGDNVTNSLYICILIPDNIDPNDFHLERGGSQLGLSSFKSNELAMNDANNYKYRDDNFYTRTQLEYLEARGCIIFTCIGHYIYDIYHIGTNRLNRQDDWNEARPDGRYWTRSNSSEQSHSQAYHYWFQSKDMAGFHQPAANSTYDDLRSHLLCVRLICPYDGTHYIWDPDQM